MSLQEKLAKMGNNLKDLFHSIIDTKQMRELARETGFVKRFSSRLRGDEFIQSLLIESVDGEKSTLRGTIDTLGQIKTKAIMSAQALGKRINTKAAVALVERVFENTLNVVMNKIRQVISTSKIESSLLSFFQCVYLQDSTENLLHEALQDKYRGSSGGCGDGRGDASVKIDLIYEYKRKVLSFFKITDRKEPDSVLGWKILEFIKQGDLVIRDLGYSCTDVFKKIQEAGPYFLSRLHPSVGVYLKLSDTAPTPLGHFLEKKAKGSGVVDTMVYISHKKFQCRLIAYRVPPEIKNDRRRAYLKECRKKKRKPKKEYIQRLSFTVFITNVPVTMWTAEVVGTIYRLRWQVELIFKSWKSDLNFDYLKGTNHFRITCLIYARLTVILMMFTVYACVDSLTLEVLEKEVSIHKLIDWITRNGRFFEIVTKGFSKNLWNRLVEHPERLLCKENRKGRKTTRELIEMEAPFGCLTC